MEAEYITYLSYLSGGTLSAALTLVFFNLWNKGATHFSLVLAALISTAWHVLIALNYRFYSLDTGELIALEIIRYGAWIFAILEVLKFTAGAPLPQTFYRGLNLAWAAALLSQITLIASGLDFAHNSNLLIWSGLILSIVGLVCVEQLFKNTGRHRLIKLYSLIIGAMFSYDIYLFSYSLIFDQIDPILWEARGAINGLAALLMAVGALSVTAPQLTNSGLSLSRPVAFYSTSLTASGTFLAVMALAGYYVQLYGGSWGEIIHVILLFVALLLIATLFISTTIRSRLNVWINKHFFRHKYDYRTEWLKLINALSAPADTEDFEKRALDILIDIFKSGSGGIWTLQDKSFAPSCNNGLKLPNECKEAADTAFCRALHEHEWVFSPNSPDNKQLAELNDLLPEWIREIHGLWLVIPLLTEDKLLGFAILTEPSVDAALTWEDLDLLKTVGRQLASYLDRHQAAELLAESRQFEAFNKLTAFIMHDLKNLIAQQALVVENAAKHKDNPAFVEDAINTIDNSVSRMNTLLKKLQQDEPAELRSLDLAPLLVEAIKKCQELSPKPSLHLEVQHCHVNADPDRLLMTIVHIIKNAQEATDYTGFVDATLRSNDNSAIITIEDNGSGMSKEFIASQLFKPFNTTKSGKGMGIGVFQAKEYIESIGGQVQAESEPEKGTVFTLTIPSIKGY